MESFPKVWHTASINVGWKSIVLAGPVMQNSWTKFPHGFDPRFHPPLLGYYATHPPAPPPSFLHPTAPPPSQRMDSPYPAKQSPPIPREPGETTTSPIQKLRSHLAQSKKNSLSLSFQSAPPQGWCPALPSPARQPSPCYQATIEEPSPVSLPETITSQAPSASSADANLPKFQFTFGQCPIPSPAPEEKTKSVPASSCSSVTVTEHEREDEGLSPKAPHL